jgi:hypothetical protein
MNKVAFIACGLLREFSSCYPSWNIFDSQDNYVFTWDLDYKKSCLEKPIPSITKIEDLIEAKDKKIILDYQVYKDNGNINPTLKSPFLWSYVEDNISYDYDYVLLTRPDMYFYKRRFPTLIHPGENEIQVFCIDGPLMGDYVFFMRRSTYSVFVKYFSDYITKNEHMHMIHHQLTDFFDKHKNFIINDNLKKFFMCDIRRPSVILSAIGEESFMCNLSEEFKISFDRCRPPERIGVPYEIALLLINPTILTPKERDLALHKLNTPIINYSHKIFEAESLEIGLDKIKTYTYLTGRTFKDILTVNMEELNV